jgi:hypothetical protein
MKIFVSLLLGSFFSVFILQKKHNLVDIKKLMKYSVLITSET